MRKELQFDATFPKTGEPTVRVVAWPRGDGRLGIEKAAFAQSHSPLYDFLKTVRPEPGATFLLINALGSWEFYGENRNGDTFPERPVEVGRRALCGHPECTASLDGWVTEPETLLHHYKSFETQGRLHLHHQNGSPDKAVGSIEKAVWNPRMHRVELLAKLIDRLAPAFAQRIAAHEDVAGSMGCRVRRDVCSICGHRAPTRAQYCEHAMSHLRETLPDGRVIAVHNPSPVFFDYSLVIKPADKIAWTLLKVAERGPAPSSALLGETRELTARHAADLWDAAAAIHAAWRDPQSLLGAFTKVAEAARTPLDLGDARLAVRAPRFLAQGEVAKLAGRYYGLGDLPENLVDRLVAATPALVALLGAAPDLVKAADLGPVGEVLRDRAYAPWRNVPTPEIGPGAAWRAAEPPRTDPLTITDPYTGHTYQTTRGAAQDAARGDVHHRLLRTALFTGLYGAGIHRLLRGRLGVLGSVGLGVVPALATDQFIQKTFPPYRHPYYVTDQGIPVSGGTEFKEAALTPSSWATKLAADGTERGGWAALDARLAGTRFGAWARLPLDAQVDGLLRYAVSPASALGHLLTT